MRRMLAVLALLMLLPGLVLCEAPRTLPSSASVKEVEQFLLLPPKFSMNSVRRGYIRYIAQNEERDDAFRVKYWLGGPLGSEMDLTLTERGGVRYPYHAGVMCSRAAYSMALSYLGVDMTPGDMSAMMHSRNLDEPYDMITWKLGNLQRIKGSTHIFNEMVENYLSDPSYSPVYLYFRRPNGSCHSVLVVATIPEKSRYLVVDSNPIQSGGKLYRIYFISLSKNRTEIVNSTFRKELKGSRILQVHQWRLIEGEAPLVQ